MAYPPPLPLASRYCSLTSINGPLIKTGFFPYPANGDWSSAYDSFFSTSLLASFNGTRYDFAGFKALYTSFNASIDRNFLEFRHGFLTVVGVPNSNDKGGFAYATGWEGGKTVIGTDLWFTDATYAVIEEDASGYGGRKIVEFREASNIPNAAAIPAGQPWSCQLPY